MVRNTWLNMIMAESCANGKVLFDRTNISHCRLEKEKYVPVIDCLDKERNRISTWLPVEQDQTSPLFPGPDEKPSYCLSPRICFPATLSGAAESSCFRCTAHPLARSRTLPGPLRFSRTIVSRCAKVKRKISLADRFFILFSLVGIFSLPLAHFITLPFASD